MRTAAKRRGKRSPPCSTSLLRFELNLLTVALFLMAHFLLVLKLVHEFVPRTFCRKYFKHYNYTYTAYINIAGRVVFRFLKLVGSLRALTDPRLCT